MCRVHIADVRNARENPEFMGQMGPRPVIAADAVTWVRSALETMNAFPRLRLVGEGDEADLELRIELIKAYVMSYASAKASDVVVRVGYSRQGRKLDERVIRGTDNGTNWINGEGEMQSSLNGALASLVQQLDRDVIAHCDDASKTVSKAQ